MATQNRLSTSEVKRHLENLPVLPTVVTRMMELDPASADFFEDVLALAEQDPTFATRILSVANSAAYRSTQTLTSLQHAVTRVGTQRVVQLVTSMGVMRVFAPSTPAQRNLWIHSVQTAVSASMIAQLGITRRVDRGQAYLGGLMHDLGRFVLLDLAPETFESVEETSWRTPEQLIEAERSACGSDHAKLGAAACKHWGLPNFVVELVLHHHRYDATNDPSLSSEVTNLIGTIQMADLFSILMLRNPDFSKWESEDLATQIARDCCHPSWTALPAVPASLADRAPHIKAECDRLVAELGLED